VKYIPTVTGAWTKMDLDGVDEVLLTPSLITPGLPKEPKTIIIDNGYLQLNLHKKPLPGVISRMKAHLELCRKLREDRRCIFVLPSYLPNPELGLLFQKEFLNEIKPKRYAVMDTPILEERYVYGAEFLCIPAIFSEKARYSISCYHLFGRLDNMPKARSWDDSLYGSFNLPIRETVRARSY
jgi:hypothetical protein